MNMQAELPVREAVNKLQESYLAYMSALQAVLSLGDKSIPALISLLNHKHANPVAVAMGLLMSSKAGEGAIPRLLDWVVVQSPMYPEVVEALVKAGAKAVPHLADRLEKSAAANDDEAVRHLLDVATRLPEAGLISIIPSISKLLDHDTPGIREAAADAFWRIGLPHGRCACDALQEMAKSDSLGSVRASAREALLRLGVEMGLAISAGVDS